MRPVLRAGEGSRRCSLIVNKRLGPTSATYVSMTDEAGAESGEQRLVEAKTGAKAWPRASRFILVWGRTRWLDWTRRR